MGRLMFMMMALAFTVETCISRGKIKMGGFFRAFNSLQAVSLFAACPFVLNWMASAEFTGHTPLTYCGWIVYAIGFILMTCAVFTASCDD